MIKHVGKHNNRKIIILFRQVPGEDHMCLVSYPDTLPRQLHDDIMKVLESAIGQQAKELSDALFRNVGSDGRNLLEALHREGFIKKVQTAQVLITPNTSTTVRLDELNKILNEMSKGEDAVKRLQELDNSRGMASGNRKNQQIKEVKTTSADVNGVVDAPLSNTVDTLSDGAIANSLRAQADKMIAEAKGLMAEAERLQKEAAVLVPPVIESNVKSTSTKAKKTTKVKAN